MSIKNLEGAGRNILIEHAHSLDSFECRLACKLRFLVCLSSQIIPCSSPDLNLDKHASGMVKFMEKGQLAGLSIQGQGTE